MLDDANPGAEQGAFALNADGDLTFLNGVPAYDGTAAENNDYEVRVKAVDENGLSSTKLITVTVNDALAPTIDDIPTNIAKCRCFYDDYYDTAVKTFTASDESAGTVYWQLSGTDSADFAITDAGALSFVNAPDYDSTTPANNIYDLTITVSDTAFNGDGSIPGTAHTRDVDIQVTVLGIPDITSTTFDIDETGANSGFQLAVVDEIPANVVWMLDDANPGAEQGAFALSADGDLTFLNGVPAYDGTAANNDYEVRVKAVDEDGLSSTKADHSYG